MLEVARIDTRAWITHRFKLADTPAVFPEDIAGNPAGLKAVIEGQGGTRPRTRFKDPSPPVLTPGSCQE